MWIVIEITSNHKRCVEFLIVAKRALKLYLVHKNTVRDINNLYLACFIHKFVSYYLSSKKTRDLLVLPKAMQHREAQETQTVNEIRAQKGLETLKIVNPTAKI